MNQTTDCLHFNVLPHEHKGVSYIFHYVNIFAKDVPGTKVISDTNLMIIQVHIPIYGVISSVV